MVTTCRCPSRSASPDLDGIYYNVVVLEGNFIVGMLDRNVNASIQGCIGSIDVIVYNQFYVVYRESRNRRLVRIKIADIKAKNYGSWEYLPVPPELSLIPVSHMWMAPNGNLAILWNDGQFSLPHAQNQVFPKPLKEIVSWNTISPSLSEDFLIGGFSAATQLIHHFVLVCKNGKKISEVSFEGLYNNYSSSITRIVDLKTSGSEILKLAIGVVSCVHLFRCRQKRVSLIFSNLQISTGQDFISTFDLKDSDIYIGYGMYGNQGKMAKVSLMFN